MALQDVDALALLGLGVHKDAPPDPLQPPLVDGIHLRWGFGRSKGFPWHGYYLLRRPHRKQERTCLRPRFRGIVPPQWKPTAGGVLPLGSDSVTFSDGTLSSDQPLVVTDDFPPPGYGELDLRNRAYLRFAFAPQVRAYFVSYAVGLRKEQDDRRFHCIQFGEKDEREGPNPRLKDDARFTVYGARNDRVPRTNVQPIKSFFALDCGQRAEIELPCIADAVVLVLLNSGRPGHAIGIDANGREVAKAEVPRSAEPERIDLNGPRIARVAIVAPEGEMLLVAVCYRCVDQKGGEPVRARAFAGNVLLEEQIVSGSPGSVVLGAFEHDLITAVEFTGGNAALVDLCYTAVAGDARAGWSAVPKCPQPIAIPARHPAYPANGGVATDQLASENDAVGRITYGNHNVWRGAPFAALHTALLELVHGGPGGAAMSDIASANVPGVPAVPSDQQPPNLSAYRPLNFVLLASAHAPVAQMLGLYWADQTAAAGQQYDYMIAADHNNVGQHDIAKFLAWLAGPQGNFTDIDAWIAYGLEAKSSADLAAPAGLQAYALPGSTVDRPDGTLRDATNNAGLRWTLPTLANGKLASGAAVMYRVRRAALGKTKPPAPVAAAAHQPVGSNPHMVAEPTIALGETPERPADWPPFPMHYLDGALADGWYSYRINGIDLFGRYSAQSAPAAWYQWTPAPDPAPWYYDAAVGAGAVYPHAISLLDKRPPPPPPAVEAFALDRRDPLLQRDAAYDAWWASLSAPEQQSVLGLRVRWIWTYAQMRQAPDTAEFRVYYQPGHLNTLTGHITGVTAAPPDNSQIQTDIANPAGANAFVDLHLRSGGHSFKIVANAAGSPLTLTVENLAPDHSIAPAGGQSCVISLQPGTASYLDYRQQPPWQSRMWVVPYANAVAEGVLPAPGPGGAPLAGAGATSAATTVTLPAGTDIAGIRAYTSHIYLADDTARPSRIYLVRGVDVAARQVTVDGAPVLAGGSSNFELGVLMRRYEVFLPAPNDADRGGLALTVSQAEPIAYGRIGVTAVDDKTHTADDPARAGRWGNRHGNESTVGGPATVFRVHRDPPAPPAMPPDSDAVFASPADYNSNSYYTFRWVPQANVETHVFRAMDSALFARDWLIRSTRTALSAAQKNVFPDGWSANKCNNAAGALNAIGGPGSYQGLSADAKEVLGRLPGNEGYASRGGLNARDWEIRRTRAAIAETDAVYFPADWGDAQKRKGAADLLNAIAAPGDYRNLTNDAMRVLAGLPGNETAFQQVTSATLPNLGSTTDNRLGPDNAANYPIDPTLRAYVDRLDGRSTNRYFYRAAFIDQAHNIGPLGLSSPPVHMPDVVPPRAPAFTRVLAGAATPQEPGDGKITLRWNSNREPDLAAYHLYRTADETKVRDIRLMDLVQEVAVAAGDPAARPAEVVYVDTPPKALVTYTYRLVATDAVGNPSAPSVPVAARAFDTALPEVPALTAAWVEVAGVTRAEIAWNSPHEVLLQRREATGPWIDLAQWRPPGAVTVRDPYSDPAKDYDYRALARKATGALKRGTAVTLSAQP
jgi:hypothetical protein